MTIKRICYIGIFSALYAVFSFTLKFPIIGHTYCDLGYIVLTVACCCFNPIDAALVGGIGATVSDLTIGAYGFSISHTVCNLIIGYFVCSCCSVYKRENEKFRSLAGVTVMCVLFAILVKTLIECSLYSIPIATKIPKSLVAFILDSIVMVASLPLGFKIKQNVRM